MNKTTKVLLAISLASFLTSLTGALWGFFVPVGAIFFGLFMIFSTLGTEAELFDAQQCAQTGKVAERTSSLQRPPRTERTASLAAMSHQ